MGNSTFVGFTFPSSSTTSYTDSQVVREIQPVTTWNRDGGYTVTRRWRGPIDSLVAFSDGGSGEADYHGTYFSGASGILPGGAGRDGAVSTDLVRDEGGRLGTFSATWVTSNIASALGNPRAAGRTGTSGDLYQESSLWSLDGNDLEKSIWECPKMLDILNEIENDTTGTSCTGGQLGLTARIRASMENFKNGKDLDGNTIPDYYEKTYRVADYFDISSCPLVALNATQLNNLEAICQDYMKGVEALPISQYVLRNTKTVQYTSAVAATALIPYYADVNKIWATSDITALMLADTRPIDPPISVTNYDIPLIGVLGTVFNTSKWLYRTPDVQELSNGKWQVTREWWESTDYSVSLYTTK
jgi:hypothetical protein